MYAYVVKPHPLRDGGFKISKPRGPEGWGIYNFKNPGALRDGGFGFSWGDPNTTPRPFVNTMDQNLYQAGPFEYYVNCL